MNCYEKLTLEELIARLRERDDAAFAEVIERYKPMLNSIVSSFSDSSLDKEELMAEAYIALHSAAMRYDLSQSKVTFGLYARICIHNRFVDLLRREEALCEVCELDVDTLPDDGEIDTGLVARDTVERVLRDARELLSELEYTILMYHIQGYKTSAIAEALGRTPKSVDNAKWRIFKRLRTRLSKDGETN